MSRQDTLGPVGGLAGLTVGHRTHLMRRKGHRAYAPAWTSRPCIPLGTDDMTRKNA